MVGVMPKGVSCYSVALALLYLYPPGSLVLSKSATQSPRTKVEVTECRTLSSIRNTQNKYIFLYRHGFYNFYKNKE